ncbi:MAG: protein TolQ [Oxalobacter sp.]|jgi:biopolymer transport protein TolQ|nr:protein TolQ [Oxalobacter sp.]
MQTAQNLSFFSLISNASLIVQLIMAGLLIISLLSWAYIFQKYMTLRRARQQTVAFEERFWSGGTLQGIYKDVGNGTLDGPLARIFHAGMGEYLKARSADATHNVAFLLDSSRRAMRAAYQREVDALESHLSFLASAGSVSPYVGLFGTVWGIMNAFRGLANVQQATLATVAPGIAEALIATAIGLFAAIPAVVAYNRFSNDTDRLAVRFENFIEEFSNILQRQS